MKKFVISRVVKQTVEFFEDDFDTREEFEAFFAQLKTDEDLLVDTFFDSLDEDTDEAGDIKLEDIE